MIQLFEHPSSSSQQHPHRLPPTVISLTSTLPSSSSAHIHTLSQFKESELKEEALVPQDRPSKRQPPPPAPLLRLYCQDLPPHLPHNPPNPQTSLFNLIAKFLTAASGPPFLQCQEPYKELDQPMHKVFNSTWPPLGPADLLHWKISDTGSKTETLGTEALTEYALCF
ncbi:hypothetical protein MMC17_004207 [Xylographa soralifera]|nr:hypothetical protein [Xylographa soralifera]